jgi:hypothetical protein
MIIKHKKKQEEIHEFKSENEYRKSGDQICGNTRNRKEASQTYTDMQTT